MFQTDALPFHDPDQLGALLLQLEPRLRAVALRYTRNADEAADVLQNAFEKVVRHAPRFRGGSAVSTWLHRIVVNEALMWLRSERRHARHRSDEVDVERLAVADPATAAPDAIAEREIRARLAHEIARLAPAERLVIERCALAGDGYRDFARDSGDDPAAVKSRAFRARRKLESALRD
jgi:RNA polymerase sigma-70 factor (ECF subfamily)